MKNINNCSVIPSSKIPKCFSNVIIEQYKSPCNYLPLDGCRQNTYPLSHNPQCGGKKKYSKKKGGFLNELLKQANRLAVPISLVAARELLKKGSKKKNKKEIKKNFK